MNNFEAILDKQRNSLEKIENKVLKTSLYHKHRSLVHLDIGSKEKVIGLEKQMATFPTEKLQHEKSIDMIIKRTQFGDLSADNLSTENLYDLLSQICRYRITFPIRNFKFFKSGYHTYVLGFPAFLPYESLSFEESINIKRKNRRNTKVSIIPEEGSPLMVRIHSLNMKKKYIILQPVRKMNTSREGV